MRQIKKISINVIIFIIVFSFRILAKNYDALTEYYSVVTELGQYEMNFDIEWINILNEDSQKAKSKSETGKDVNYKYNINEHNLYKNEIAILDSQSNLIKTLANYGNDCSNQISSFKNSVNQFYNKWNNYFSNIKNGHNNTYSENDNGKKKPIGHANVGGKIWKAGDSLEKMNNDNLSNPLNTPVTSVTQSVNNNPDEIFADFGSVGSFRAPKDYIVNNGVIHFKKVVSGRDKDEVDGSIQKYIKVTYLAEINDSKGESLHFNFVINGQKKIPENVSVYDNEFSTYIYEIGTITVEE